VSRAKAMEKREPGEAYMTPPALALACARVIHGFLGDEVAEVIEPSCGTGAFVRAARACWPRARIFAVDSDKRFARPALKAGSDAFSPERWERFAPAWKCSAPAEDRTLVIGNPPYSLAAEHITAALDALRPGDAVAMLLRTNLLGSHARVPFWRKHPATFVAPVIPRPSFTGGGADSTEYALFAWFVGSHTTPVLMEPVIWRAKR
jgi:predicted RNA methylase